MPRITDNLESHGLQNDSFGYSAVGLDKLGASEYTLVTIVCDRSGSVNDFKTELAACLKEIVNACRHSPRADNLMIRLVMFGNDMEEIHGFKLLSNCNLADYDNAVRIEGNTALFDAAANAVSATADWGRQLTEQDFNVNAIVVCITDGDDNASTLGVGAVRSALSKATKNEALESLVSILVAVNMTDPHMKDRLDSFHKEAGFTQFVAINNANAKSLAKLAEFVSKSISAQSQALGTGSMSAPLTI